MIQPFILSRAFVCAASLILLCGVADGQRQTQSAPVPAGLSTSAATSALSASAPALSSTSKPPLPAAAPPPKPTPTTGSTSSTADSPEAVREADEASLIEGEKRFATNCGRCHQAPHKFPPRMMATIVRHMRVRATITDDDMRLILRYMTQ